MLKIEERAKKLKSASIIDLIIFVEILLHPTGLWIVIALESIFKMRIKDTLLGIFIGNVIAGAIMRTVFMHIEDGGKYRAFINSYSYY